MVTQKSLDGYKEKLQGLERHLLLGKGDVTYLEVQIAECHSKITSFSQALQTQTATLGVNEHADLSKLHSNAYLQVSDYFHLLMVCPLILLPLATDEYICS